MADFLPAEPILVSVATSALAEGGLFVALASFVHEEYGTENFGVLYGTMLAFGGAGLFTFDEVFFPTIFEWYATETAAGYQAFNTYGQWNVFLFSVLAVLYLLCTILAIVSHVSVQNREGGDNKKLKNMIQF